jgi:hypothetical protein
VFQSLWQNALVLTFTFFVLILLVKDFVIDINFYRSNHWDWAKQSGRELRTGILPLEGKLVSNRHRVLFGLPIFISAAFVFLAIQVFILMR